MKSFKNWLLKEESMSKRVLAVFDFDGTIANVPEKPGPNAPRHHWNNKDWWGSEASLEAPFYDGGVNQEVVDAFKAAKSDPETHAILLTGRRGINAHAVRNVLRNQGLVGRRVIPDSNSKEMDKFKELLKHKKDVLHPEEMHDDSHDEYYSGDHRTESDYPIDPNSKKGKPAGDTMSHKTFVVKKLMHDGLEEVHFWDDRPDHVANWMTLGHELLQNWPNLKNAMLHRVTPPSGSGKAKARIEQVPIH